MSKLVIIALAATALSMPVLAQNRDNDASNDVFIGHEVDVSFEVSRASLTAEGYTLVTMVDGDPLSLSALNPQGNEVELTVDPQTGLIHSSVDVSAKVQ